MKWRIVLGRACVLCTSLVTLIEWFGPLGSRSSLCLVSINREAQGETIIVWNIELNIVLSMVSNIVCDSEYS